MIKCALGQYIGAAAPRASDELNSCQIQNTFSSRLGRDLATIPASWQNVVVLKAHKRRSRADIDDCVNIKFSSGVCVTFLTTVQAQLTFPTGE